MMNMLNLQIYDDLRPSTTSKSMSVKYSCPTCPTVKYSRVRIRNAGILFLTMFLVLDSCVYLILPRHHRSFHPVNSCFAVAGVLRNPKNTKKAKKGQEKMGEEIFDFVADRQ